MKFSDTHVWMSFLNGLIYLALGIPLIHFALQPVCNANYDSPTATCPPGAKYDISFCKDNLDKCCDLTTAAEGIGVVLLIFSGFSFLAMFIQPQEYRKKLKTIFIPRQEYRKKLKGMYNLTTRRSSRR